MKEKDVPYTLFDVRNFGDFLPDGLFICDQAGTIVYVNKKNQEYTGIDSASCIGKNFDQFIAADSTAITPHLIKKGQEYTALVTNPRNGLQLMEVGSPILHNGESVGAVIVDRDISQLTLTRELLLESETKLASVNEIRERQEEIIKLLTKPQHKKFVWESPAMEAVAQLAEKASATDVTVLLLGETGVGKEVVANFIYEVSQRAHGPFIKVNCGALPSSLIESELFGYEKGAFTGANPKGKPGAFELANGGTLLLDEVSEIPLEDQAKLLRVIQEKKLTRVGGNSPIDLDVRLIASTNRNLLDMVREGTFRQDLFYRLNVLPITIPPLRERKEDIPRLTKFFIDSFSAKYKKTLNLEFSAYAGLNRYDWPGNIRELENLIERWFVIYPNNTVLFWDMIASDFNVSTPVDIYEGKTYKQTIEDYERSILKWGMYRYGSIRKMAKAMDIDYSTISKKAKRLGMKLTDPGE